MSSQNTLYCSSKHLGKRILKSWKTVYFSYRLMKFQCKASFTFEKFLNPVKISKYSQNCQTVLVLVPPGGHRNVWDPLGTDSPQLPGSQIAPNPTTNNFIYPCGYYFVFYYMASVLSLSMDGCYWRVNKWDRLKIQCIVCFDIVFFLCRHYSGLRNVQVKGHLPGMQKVQQLFFKNS